MPWAAPDTRATRPVRSKRDMSHCLAVAATSNNLNGCSMIVSKESWELISITWGRELFRTHSFAFSQMSDRKKHMYCSAYVAFAALSMAATCFLQIRSRAAAAPQAQDRLAADYTNGVRPLLTKYCHRCHSDKLTEAEINLAQYAALNDARKG